MDAGPTQTPVLGPGRRRTLTGVFLLAMAGLLWRAVDLQVTHKEFLQSQGDARHLRVVTTPAYRGPIVDRNHEVLAVSTPLESLWLNPQEVSASEIRSGEAWGSLGKTLGMAPAEVARLVEDRPGRAFVYLRRQVDPQTAATVEQLDLRGVYSQREYGRYYPLGEAAAHILGFTNVDDVGQEGLELAFDQWLRGRNGVERVVRDRLGRIVEAVERVRAPRGGRELVTSLDWRIQSLAYRALLAAVERHGARGGSVVVVDPRTGEVLAMVNQPSYNPNNRADRISARFRNRAATDVFEPGSTVKPFTIAAALETGRFTPDTPVDTAPGHYRVGSHTVRDIRNYGLIDVATVIKKSSNVGATKLALAVGSERMWELFSRAGFGEVTGSGFPGEVSGVLTPFQEWTEIHRCTLSFGYGLSVTPLQLAQAYGAIANGGLMRRSTFQKTAAPSDGERVMSVQTAFHVRRMLEQVVSDGGTGARAQVKGYRVAGKTGTVHKPVAGGYAEDRYLAVFAGFAPVSAPRLVVVATIDEPRGEEYYGGQVAAPVFAEIMAGALRALGVAPDDPVVLRAGVTLADRGSAASGGAVP